MSSLTPKDITDLKLCLDLSLDYIALSFVQKAKDIVDLKKYVGNQTGIMAKFEKPMAIKKMDEILKQCDAAMVARGDLGVEMPPEEVPIIQKELFNHAEITVFQLLLPLKCSIQWLTPLRQLGQKHQMSQQQFLMLLIA